MNEKLKYYLDTLSLSNRELYDLVNISKISKNIEEIIMHLNQLNYIISFQEDEIKTKIKYLWSKNKDCFKVVLILLAINDKNILVNVNKRSFPLSNWLDDPERIFTLLKETNFLILLTSGKIKNFVDYCVGVEVGLDSNSRKNRGGAKIEIFIFKELDNIFKENKNILIKRQQKINSNINILNDKVFDFIIENINTGRKILIESSYYNAGGSKISETAKSFTLLNESISKLDNFKFIWLADGFGMTTIKKYLEKVIDNNFIYNHYQFLKEIKKIVVGK